MDCYAWRGEWTDCLVPLAGPQGWLEWCYDRKAAALWKESKPTTSPFEYCCDGLWELEERLSFLSGDSCSHDKTAHTCTSRLIGNTPLQVTVSSAMLVPGGTYVELMGSRAGGQRGQPLSHAEGKFTSELEGGLSAGSSTLSPALQHSPISFSLMEWSPHCYMGPQLLSGVKQGGLTCTVPGRHILLPAFRCRRG
ncbi:hypothetical protein AOLI_G00131020 [Acnodon oligacanthus]